MQLLLDLEPAVFNALAAIASAKNISVEQATCELIETFFTLHGVPESAFDDWVKAKVEEGLKSIEEGRCYTNEEVMEKMEKHLAKLEALSVEQE